MSRDISQIIEGWDYDPDGVSVRIVEGVDGRARIQMRLDLGLIQMEFDGRPDGQRPEGRDSWLEYYEARQREHDAAHPDSKPFLLRSDDCSKLLREGVQYYHRYVSFWHLRRYELCARDTSRNLRLFAFVRNHAQYDRDKLQFDQWRPYVTMMHARAVATPLVELGDAPAAVGAIDAGITGIRTFLRDYSQLERAEQCAELMFLEKWRRELLAEHAPSGGETDEQPSGENGAVESAAEQPVDILAVLRARLEKAITEERFEEAAQIRDELRRQTGSPDLP